MAGVFYDRREWAVSVFAMLWILPARAPMDILPLGYSVLYVMVLFENAIYDQITTALLNIYVREGVILSRYMLAVSRKFTISFLKDNSVGNTTSYKIALGSLKVSPALWKEDCKFFVISEKVKAAGGDMNSLLCERSESLQLISCAIADRCHAKTHVSGFLLDAGMP